MEEDYYDICKKNGGTRSMILIIGRKLGRKYEKERPIGTNFKPINIDISRLLPKLSFYIRIGLYMNVYTRENIVN